MLVQRVPPPPARARGWRSASRPRDRADLLPAVLRAVDTQRRKRKPQVDRERREAPGGPGVEPGAESLAPTGLYRGLLHGDDRKGASRLAGPRRRRRRPEGR